MESIYPELTLCGRKNLCARTDTVFFPIYEVSEGPVSLMPLIFSLHGKCRMRITTRDYYSIVQLKSNLLKLCSVG